MNQVSVPDECHHEVKMHKKLFKEELLSSFSAPTMNTKDKNQLHFCNKSIIKKVRLLYSLYFFVWT